ncbi:MAG: hypothetical protein K2M31_04425 [Muribaculaceae bacterium]|nr:hypothetical protein [Muribaculaceae bacterium]
MRIILIILATISLAFNSIARDISFSYNSDQQPIHGYGHPRPDNYDICIRIDDPEFIGATINSFSVPVPEVEGCRINPEVAVWAVENLESDPISESNSLAFINVISDGKTVEAVFPDGVRIPEEGLYLGYSLKVEENSGGARTFPIAVVNGTTPGSLYFRSSILTQWDKTYHRMEYMSPMTVDLSVDMPDFAIVTSLPEKMRVKNSSESEVLLTYTNQSIEPIHTLKYHISTPEWDDEREIEISSTDEFAYGSISTLWIPFRTPDVNGNSTLTLEILEVNGHAIVSDNRSKSSMKLRVLPEIPVYRPLVEEYTGLWCGNCPSGWVALEEARERHGEDFVFMTYHVNDILTANLQQPMSPRSVPSITVDREEYLGSGELAGALTDHLGRETDVDLRVHIQWEDDKKEALKASATTTFMEYRKDADYSLALYLVADKLSDSSWGQTNFFSGQHGKAGKYWDIFTKGGSQIYGLNYDGVATVCYNPQGIYGHIPNQINEFESFATTETFKLKDGVSMRGINLIRDLDNLRVVAVLIDNLTGRIVNSATSIPTSRIEKYEEFDGVDPIIYPSSTIEYEEYYSLSGQRLQSPLPDMPYIRLRYFSDSSVEVSKIIR